MPLAMALPVVSPMPPPVSPKEPRRSNRRSAHSSTSTSKSSGSPSPDATSLPPAKEPDNVSARSAGSSGSASASARQRRAKDEHDDSRAAHGSGHRRTSSITSLNAVNSTPTSKRTKRRGKDVALPPSDSVDNMPAELDKIETGAAEDADADAMNDDGGITRCPCEEGLEIEDDGEAMEFMIECEMCGTWQHGVCMGIANEGLIPDGEYCCEKCKPERYVELIKRLKRQRQSSEKSHHTARHSRTSRSHSPTHFQKASKRRNTMNSRDAAYEESLREILNASAAEAYTSIDSKDKALSVAGTEDAVEEIIELGLGGKRKRKRIEDDILPVKRKRSASVISERPIAITLLEKPEEVPVSLATDLSALLPPPPPSAGGKSRAKRGGRKNAPDASTVDGDEATPSRKHPNQYTYRGKSSMGTQPRRAPPSSLGTNQINVATHDHGTRRNANNAGGAGLGSGSRNAHNAYYNNMQLPMFTSWNLPDYLAHLQTILPSEVPPPLHIRGATSFFRENINATVPLTTGTADVSDETNGTSGHAEPADGQLNNADQLAAAMANATESLTERGVKVKWPAKRMSVADMNKRVRALVEWVGREQALALDRERRKTSLEAALLASHQVQTKQQSSTVNKDAPVTDGITESINEQAYSEGVENSSNNDLTNTPLVQEKPTLSITTSELPTSGSLEGDGDATGSTDARIDIKSAQSANPLLTAARPSTTKLMEELMEELINFQERFGPGAKSLPKANRIVSL